MDRLPPLTSLAAFEAFYRTGSVAGAAELLGRTHGAVSKQLHQLQDHAGTELFVKRGLHLKLTAEGRAFAQSVANGMEEIRIAYAELSGSQGHHAVAIAASSTFARHWLIPTIARFNIDHPDIDILIRVTGAQGSRKAEGPVDLEISWDRLVSSAEEHPAAQSLGDVHIGPVLSPACPHTMRDGVLTVPTLIHRRGNEMAWTRWAKQSGTRVEREREMTFDLYSLAFEAAERAMGATIAPKFLIEHELKRGSLIAPAGFLIFQDGLLVRPSSERPKPTRHTKIFFDWLIENARLDADGFMATARLPDAPSDNTLNW